MILATITLCASILSASPGCRVITEVMRDSASSELACTKRLQELIAEKMPLYPASWPGRWGCHHRKD